MDEKKSRDKKALFAAKAPEKTSLNLMQLDKEVEKKDTGVLLIILAVVSLIALAYYFILVPVQKMRAEERAADEKEAELAQWQLQNADYSKIESAYNVYYGPWLNENEALLQDRADILDLLERVVMPAATVRRIHITESNVFTLTLTDISVAGMYDLIDVLGSEPLVAMTKANRLDTADIGTSEDIQFELTITVVDVGSELAADDAAEQ